MQQQSSKTRKLYFTFGRFQPFTTAHADMFEHIINLSSKDKADYCICISPTQDIYKNVFSWEERCHQLRISNPQIKINPTKEAKLDKLIKSFVAQGYTDIYFVIGKDRIDDFQWIYKYKEELGFHEFKIIEYGNRTKASVSATKARQAALNNNYGKFCRILPTYFTNTLVHNMFTTIRERLQ